MYVKINMLHHDVVAASHFTISGRNAWEYFYVFPSVRFHLILSDWVCERQGTAHVVFAAYRVSFVVIDVFLRSFFFSCYLNHLVNIGVWMRFMRITWRFFCHQYKHLTACASVNRGDAILSHRQNIEHLSEIKLIHSGCMCVCSVYIFRLHTRDTTKTQIK